MTPMSNADYLIRLQHADDLDALKEAKKAAGLSYQKLAEKIGVNKVWLASAFEGQQFVPEEYGPALKDLIHEQGGNAIMSAIDFGLDCDVIVDDDGNHRVIITLDGKLLPYAKKGQYPW